MDQRRIPNWLGLPEGIIELVINKLHFIDQLYALAVCKTWQACKNYVKSRDRIPWIMNHESLSMIDNETFVFKCELFDPYTRKVRKVSDSVDTDDEKYVDVFCSKNGWVLLCSIGISSIFLHNPFTKKLFSLPLYMFGDETLATMKATPTSPECEIFMVYMFESKLGIESFRFSELEYGKDDGNRRRCLIAPDGEIEIDDSISSVLYMRGNLYVLCHEGSLYSYGLEDGSWKLLTSIFPEPHNSWTYIRSDSWLVEINDELMAVVLDVGDGEQYDWMVLRFDRYEMSWIVEACLENCAIYISGNVAFSAPLAHRGKKILEGCKLFYRKGILDFGAEGFMSFILNEAGKARKVKPKEYGWIVSSSPCDLNFIEPPYLRI